MTARRRGACLNERRIRVLRVIARLNMGGPAHHVAILSEGLTPLGYDTLLVTGRVGPGEAPLDSLLGRGVEHRRVEALGPAIDPRADARSLLELVRIVRRFQPDIVHTHTAKAGLLGRLAALAAGRRPLIVHTYHGHVLIGYFGALQTGFYRQAERIAARFSDCLIGVSSQTVDDLVRLGIAPRDRFRVVPLGLNLDPFLRLGDSTETTFRAELGARPEDVVLSFVGRLVPIKRVDVALRAVAAARAMGAPVVLAVIGDGELRGELEALARSLGIEPWVRFLGYRRDLEEVAGAVDVAVLTSDNEGTPVSLIEAAAAARPAVATDVGGVRSVVAPGCGRLAGAGDVEGLARAIVELAGDRAVREAMGDRAREHVRERFTAKRLVDDIAELYGELLARRRA